MSKVPASVEPLMDELRYWNYGDNPAFKKFAKIAMENTRGKSIVDHRTHIVDRGVRLTMSRNFDDFLQRDLKAHTFARSFAIWVLSSMYFYSVSRVSQKLLPLGRYGIRKVNETQFYQNFGWIGVAGVGLWFGTAGYAWWKCTRFAAHKFYRHVIQQNRNWIHESLEVSKYGNYYYPESILTLEDDWHESKDKKTLMSALEEQDFPYAGPYTPPPMEEYEIPPEELGEGSGQGAGESAEEEE